MEGGEARQSYGGGGTGRVVGTGGVGWRSNSDDISVAYIVVICDGVRSSGSIIAFFISK